MRVTQKNDRIEIRIREQDNTLEFFCHGDVEFSSDDRGVVAVTDSFRVRENTGGHVRQAGFTASHAGIDIAYAVNRRATDFDADGEAWLARVIGRAVRETKFGAKQRAERILTQSGVMGVMAEIAAFEYQAPKTAYVNVLLANLESVPDEALVNLLVLAEEALSDSQTARLMDAIMDRAPEDRGAHAGHPGCGQRNRLELHSCKDAEDGCGQAQIHATDRDGGHHHRSARSARARTARPP